MSNTVNQLCKHVCGCYRQCPNLPPRGCLFFFITAALLPFTQSAQKYAAEVTSQTWPLPRFYSSHFYSSPFCALIHLDAPPLGTVTGLTFCFTRGANAIGPNCWLRHSLFFSRWKALSQGCIFQQNIFVGTLKKIQHLQFVFFFLFFYKPGTIYMPGQVFSYISYTISS